MLVAFGLVGWVPQIQADEPMLNHTSEMPPEVNGTTPALPPQPGEFQRTNDVAIAGDEDGGTSAVGVVTPATIFAMDLNNIDPETINAALESAGIDTSELTASEAKVEYIELLMEALYEWKNAQNPGDSNVWDDEENGVAYQAALEMLGDAWDILIDLVFLNSEIFQVNGFELFKPPTPLELATFFEPTNPVAPTNPSVILAMPQPIDIATIKIALILHGIDTGQMSNSEMTLEFIELLQFGLNEWQANALYHWEQEQLAVGFYPNYYPSITDDGVGAPTTQWVLDSTAWANNTEDGSGFLAAEAILEAWYDKILGVIAEAALPESIVG